MNKISAKEYYERLVLLRVQLFLRAVAFGGTLLILGKLQPKILGFQSYPAALAILFSIAAVVATIDLLSKFLYKRIMRIFSKKK